MTEKPMYIAESKWLCEFRYKMDPDIIPSSKIRHDEAQFANRKREYSELLLVSRDFMRKLLQFMEGTPTLVLISDNEGCILEMYGDQMIQESVQALGINEGVLFTEEEIGTNSISFALKTKEPVKLIGPDHYHTYLHTSACMTVPFFLDNVDEVSGTISIMTTIEYASSFHMGLLSSVVDSIERELKILRQNRRLNLLHQVMADSTQNGIVITNTDGIITDFNRAGERITGINRKIIVGDSIEKIRPVYPFMKQVLDNGKKFQNVEVTFHSIDKGISRICLLDAMPISDESQNIIGAYGQFKDITDRIELEKQVLAAEKLSAVGKLGAGLAHEIRNPLTSVIGFFQLLQTEQDEEKTNKHHRVIMNELERIKQLLNQFVSMAKPSEQNKRECVLEELVNETIYLMKNQASAQRIIIDFKSKLKKNTMVTIDESQIKQILINLLQNAMEAIVNDGEIKVTLSEELRLNNSFVQIQIDDNGEGLTEQEVSSIFAPFYSSKKDGLGLGLSICKQLIELHQGSISVTSVKGKGTSFTLLLPRFPERNKGLSLGE